ncbi:MAG: Panacea domain-containing protein, partial [Mariprofundaceae bacterium]
MSALAKSPFCFDAEKALEAILYIAKKLKSPTLHSISKVLYFSDKKHLDRYGAFIFGDNYHAMKHGPVPSGAYDIMKCARGDGGCSIPLLANSALSVNEYHVSANRDFDEDFFSESNFECLDESLQEYG